MEMANLGTSCSLAGHRDLVVFHGAGDYFKKDQVACLPAQSSSLGKLSTAVALDVSYSTCCLCSAK